MRVIGADGNIYASRDLLLHFIEEHGYYPPEEFIEALCFSKTPESKKFSEYESRYEEDELYFWGESDSYIANAEKLISSLKENQYNLLSKDFERFPDDINIVFHHGSLLSYAILNSSSKQTEFLLSSGINIGQLSRIELLQAIQKRQTAIAIELIEAEIPFSNFSNYTNPLFYAISYNQLEIIKLLLRHKMDPSKIYHSSNLNLSENSLNYYRKQKGFNLFPKKYFYCESFILDEDSGWEGGFVNTNDPNWDYEEKNYQSIKEKP